MCITAVEGHSSEVSAVILILSPTITIVIIVFTMMPVMRTDYEATRKHPTQLTK